MLLLMGLLLAVIALPVSDQKEEKTENLFGSSYGDENTIDKSELETKLENLLGSVEGVGKVQVLLMEEEEKDTMGFSGGGQIKVNGVLIAAEGADDFVTVQNIQQAVMALFQVEAHKIKVMKMK